MIKSKLGLNFESIKKTHQLFDGNKIIYKNTPNYANHIIFLNNVKNLISDKKIKRMSFLENNNILDHIPNMNKINDKRNLLRNKRKKKKKIN